MLVAVRPFYPQFLADCLFSGEHNDAPHWHDPYVRWRTEAAKLGIKLCTWDMVPLKGADVLFFLELPASPDVVREAKACAPKAKAIAMLIESPLEKAHWFHPETHAMFDAILTYCPTLVDRKKIFPFLIPIGDHQPVAAAMAPFEERKKFVVINGNKHVGWRAAPPWSPRAYPTLITRLRGWRVASMSRHGIFAEELYSRRRQLIRLAEKMMPGQIEVWGHGWQPAVRTWWHGWGAAAPFPSARGPLGNKLTVAGRYRFSLCFENCRNNASYISEKLIDALYCGIVPVYLGAENVADYFPADTYVDARQFQTDRKLLEFVNTCSAAQWQILHDAGQKFIVARGHAPFLPAAFAENLNRVLLRLGGGQQAIAR